MAAEPRRMAVVTRPGSGERGSVPLILAALGESSHFSLAGVYQAGPADRGAGQPARPVSDLLQDERVDVAYVADEAQLALLAPRFTAPGRVLLLDPDVLTLLPDKVRELAPPVEGAATIVVYPHRFIDIARRIHDAVAAGQVGLPWAAHVDLLWSRDQVGDPVLTLAEVIDLVSYLTASKVVSGVAYAGQGGQEGGNRVAFCACTLEHGIVATCSRGTLPEPGAREIGSLRVMGSHGMAVGDLHVPRLVVGAGQAQVHLEEGDWAAALLEFLLLPDLTRRATDLLRSALEAFDVAARLQRLGHGAESGMRAHSRLRAL